MSIRLSRRSFLAATALGVGASSRTAFAQAAPDVAIGAVFPFTGAAAQTGADARTALEVALDIINTPHPDLDLPLAKGSGLPGLGGAKIRLVYADHQSDPQKGRAEAERIILQDKVSALIGSYQSAVAATLSQTGERYQVPYLASDNSSPSLSRRGLKYFFRPGAQDEMFSKAMFDFLDALRAKGTKIETLALFHEDTIFGTDSATAQTNLAKERGYKVVTDIRYRANSPSLTSEVLQLKNADADVVMPSSYTNDAILLVKTMGEVGYKPKNIVAQDAGFADKALFDAVGGQLEGAISRGSFSLDLAQKRPSVGKVNDLFKARSGKDLNDLTSRELMGLIILAAGIDAARSAEGPKIRDALATLVIPGEQTIMPWRDVKFGPDGQNNEADPVLLQYRSGRYVTIFPQAVAVTEAKWPMQG